MGNIIDRLTGKDALKRQLAEARQLRDDDLRQLAEVRKLRDDDLRQLAEVRKLRDGDFYNPIETVWVSSTLKFSRASLDAVRRSEPHLFYQKTIDAANSDDLKPAYESGRSEYDPGSSLATNARDSKTEASRKRRLHEITIDGGHRSVAEVAHLIPYAPRCARFYGPLVEAAVGWNLMDDPSIEVPKKKLKQMVLVHGQYDPSSLPNKKRKENTGLKHCRTNMARIVAQKQFLDFNPSQLFLPILSLDETLGYSKGKYQVLVACASADVYYQSLFLNLCNLCTQDDVKVATETLTSFVKAAAYTLSLADERELEKRLLNPQKRRILETKQNLGDTVKVPAMRPWSNETKLMKVTLDMNDPDCHQECDPFLLFVRAAVVWSSLQNQLLLPACPAPHDCEECLEQGLFECFCEAYDPGMPIPQEINVPVNELHESVSSDGCSLAPNTTTMNKTTTLCSIGPNGQASSTNSESEEASPPIKAMDGA